MATTMEQRAKFRELRTSGISREEAQTQAYGNITPVVPTTTPAPDVNSDANRLARLQAIGGSPTAIANLQTPTTPVAPIATAPTPVTPMVTAPVDTTTGLSAPTTTPIAPTAEVKPVATVTPKAPVKTEPVIDYNVSTGRESEIQKNVTDITTANPALLKDRTAYNQAFGYDTADQGKKAMLDASFQSANTPVLINQKDIVTALLGGQSVPVQKTQAYNNAVVIADQFKKFNGMTPVQLLDNLKQGQIGTELDSLLSQNPNYAKAKAELAKAQKTASINRATQIASNVISGKETPVVDDLANIEAKYNAPIGANEQAYLSYVTQNPDVVSAGTQVKQLSNQISTLTTTYNDALKSLKAQYGDMPASALLTLMGSRTNDTKELLDSYINAKELAKGDFDLAMKMAEGHYTATSKDIAEQQQIAQEERQIKNQIDLGQAQFDQKLAQQNQMMNDPATAIQSVMSEFAGMGITSQQSLQTKIADAQKFVANGGTLAGYVDKMRQDYMAKPQYKAMQEAEMNKYAPKATENFELKQLGDKTYKFNQATGDYEVVSPLDNATGGDLRSLAPQFPGQAWAKNNNPAGITWNANFDKGQGTAKLLADAGISYSKGTARPASEGGNYVTFNTIEDGLKAQRIIMAQTYGNLSVGDMLAKWVGTSEGPNYAKQVAGNAGIDTTVKVSSLTEDQLGKLQMAKIQKESPGLAKLLQSGTQGTGTQGTQVSPEATSWVNAWNNGTMDIETILTKIGNSKEALGLKNEVIKAIDSQGGVAWRKENDPMVTKVQDLINKLGTAKDSSYLNTVAGNVQTSLTNFMTSGKDDLLADLKSVIEGGTLQQLIDAKSQGATFGALSNEELKMLQATSSALAGNAIRDPDTKEIIGFKMSETKLKSEIDKLKNLLQEKKDRMTGVGIKTEGQQPVQPQGNTNTGVGQATGVGTTYTYNGQNVTLNGGY